MVEVSDRARIKPLLRAVAFANHAYVLAIGMGACRLVEVSVDLPAHDVKVPGLPPDFTAALGKVSHKEKGPTGKTDSMSENALLTRCARAVDAALRPMLNGHERKLIIAAAEPMASIFRGVSSYPFTAPQVIAGGADATPDHELADAARAVLDAIDAARIADLAAL